MSKICITTAYHSRCWVGAAMTSKRQATQMADLGDTALRKAIVVGLAAASLSGITASAQSVEQRANQICANVMATYHNNNRASSPVGGQVLANNLLAQAANNLQNLGVTNLNMLVNALRERVAIGGNYAVAMDRGATRETLALSQRLDENGARIKNVATGLSLGQCAGLGGL